MMEALFGGLVGAIIGSAFPWWMNKQGTQSKARYLAIRVVCLLDKYVEDCVAVVKDDGLSDGQRTKDGRLEPQVSRPGVPAFPDDIDWKSIKHDLMYEILSFPSDVEAANRVIRDTWYYDASPPDYEKGFEERAFQYAQLGLKAYELAKKLRDQYKIPPPKYREKLKEYKSEDGLSYDE